MPTPSRPGSTIFAPGSNFSKKKSTPDRKWRWNSSWGRNLVEAAQSRAKGKAARQLQEWAARLRQEGDEAAGISAALDPELTALMQRYPDKRLATLYDRNLKVVVEPVKARFSTWYEMFPRSCSATPGAHGTFKDCQVAVALCRGPGVRRGVSAAHPPHRSDQPQGA